MTIRDDAISALHDARNRGDRPMTDDNIVDIILGVVLSDQRKEEPAKPLAWYKPGQKVQIFNDSDAEWYDGSIAERIEGTQNLIVNTVKGPKTIGNPNRIRAVQ